MTGAVMGQQNTWLIIGAVVFFVFLVWKTRPAGRVVPSAADKQALRKALERARAASASRDKAQALCDAAKAAAALFPDSERPKTYLLRALRVDPTWSEPLIIARKLLWKRDPASLERFLWRVLGRTPWDEEHRPVVREALTFLVALYGKRIRDRHRADALQKVIEKLES